MVNRVNYERLMEKKEKSVEKAMDKKERSIEFLGTLKDAVEMVQIQTDHPEVGTENLKRNIVDWVNFFMSIKDDLYEEVTETSPVDGGVMEKARAMVKETFPDSSHQPEAEPSRIKDPHAPATEPQRRTIYAIQKSLGRTDAIIPAELTKGQASTIIDRLKKEQAAKGGQR